MGEKALKGAAELSRQLRELGAGLAPKIIRSSLGEALKPTLSLYKATMRVGTRVHKTYRGRTVPPGYSRKNSYIATSLARDGSSASATIGYKDEAFYNLRFIETTGFTGGRGKKQGRRGARQGRKVAPVPKLEPAFKATRGLMLTSLTAALRKRIERIAAKKAGPR